ncbi:MAG TPA: adenylate/guanylate cyclase domain-containing protein [Terrimicrobiaceae bacterium]
MKLTLGQVLVLSLLGLAASLGLLFAIVLNETRATIIASSERIREQASHEISERVVSFLSTAPNAAAAFQHQIKLGLVDLNDPKAVETSLFVLLLAENDLGELTLTRAEQTGFDSEGAIQLAPTPRWQLSVVRSKDNKSAEELWSRYVHEEGGAFIADRHILESGVAQPSLVREDTEVPASDPTSHLTFSTPASKEYYDQLLWSDLHWSQLDTKHPQKDTTVEVSVQRTVSDISGKFAGVIRVGLLAEQLHRAVQLKLTSSGHEDPHRVFLCDSSGRLITRGISSDRPALLGDDLRIAPADLAPEVARALADPKLRSGAEVVSGQFEHNGREFLTTFRALPGTQEWLVGIVVPREFYLGKLVTIRNHLLAVLLGVMLFLIGGGFAILRSVRRAQEQITRESLKMNAFNFSPAATDSAFRDVSAVLESLEKAKAAMRAMSKYAPVDLVRRLYREKSEPVLGGELMEISIMFSDIKGFTTFSEQLTPNQLANVLGLYLDALSRIIQRDTHGTIDKFIGDAIMTIWNAPKPLPDHPQMACRAALRCSEATRQLAQTPEWNGLPAFQTRFGLHCDKALVGHFGARDRMNYTAIGDAINVASRLEGLNKQYGTSIIVSEAIFARAREEFDFRLLDVVAVKGKSDAITVYELLGTKGTGERRPEVIAAYEEAFAAYSARDFEKALAILKNSEGDGPSSVLIERCKTFLQSPPPANWDGVYVSLIK